MGKASFLEILLLIYGKYIIYSCKKQQKLFRYLDKIKRVVYNAIRKVPK